MTEIAAQQRQLEINLLGDGHSVRMEELEGETSPHTGRQLRHVRISFRAGPERSEAISAELTAAGEPENALKGAHGERWLVKSSSYSYSDGDSVHHHNAELAEVEEIAAKELQMFGLSLVPVIYKEVADDDGGLVITARVQSSAEVDEALEREIVRDRGDDIYFEVVRVGVNLKPVRMRFGRCLWQRTGDNRVHLLHLVSETGDSEQRRRGLGWFEPEMGHISRKVLANHDAVEALLVELEGAGVLSEEATAAIRQKRDEHSRARLRELDRSDDLDAHL